MEPSEIMTIGITSGMIIGFSAFALSWILDAFRMIVSAASGGSGQE